jgi:KDO2-lipid IV(A) lauroyltransferase
MVGDAYVLQIYPAWEGFGQSDPQDAARAMNRFIEERIREMPSQYLWTHRRYKTRPQGTPPLYPRS